MKLTREKYQLKTRKHRHQKSAGYVKEESKVGPFSVKSGFKGLKGLLVNFKTSRRPGSNFVTFLPDKS